MAYQALYRRWRPLVFDDVIGQEHITRTLKNEIMNDNLAHAYLFCGTRGTGKTSTAKILARAVNCLHPKDGNPCNECEICRGLLDETILDVVELDGASRNKVENIRDIIDDALFLPAAARKKVYIIDEVHMVTTQAFNALLKTLEEPPPHVMFILATTELNKVPATVLSRCQRFDFRRITNADIVARLKTILAGDGRQADDEALQLVAELGDGSMRDSLSILDQCLGFGEERLTASDVFSIIGIADNHVMFDLCSAVADGDGGTALTILDDVLSGGRELGVFMERFIKFLRDILVVKLSEHPEEILHVSAENLEKLRLLSEKYTRERLLHALRLLGDATVQARYSGFARTVYELAVVKMCDPSAEHSYEALADRVAVLERQLTAAEAAGFAPKAGAGVNPEQAAAQEAEDIPFYLEPSAPSAPIDAAGRKTGSVRQEENQAAPAQQADLASGQPEGENRGTGFAAAERWAEIMSYIRTHGGMPIYSHLTQAKVQNIHGRLGLVFEEDGMMSKALLSKPANLEKIEEAVAAVTGEKLKVACYSKKEVDGGPDPMEKLVQLSRKHKEIEIL